MQFHSQSEVSAARNREISAEVAEEHAAAVRQLKHIRRCQERDTTRASVGIPLRPDVIAKRDDWANDLHVKVIGAKGRATKTYAEQQLAQCRGLAQIIADFVAGRSVDLTAELPQDELAVFMALRAFQPHNTRRRALDDLAHAAGADEAGIGRVVRADEALIQTLEAAVFAGMDAHVQDVAAELGVSAPEPRRDATWGVR